MSEGRLLLVDDDVDHTTFLAERLTRDGFEVEVANSGQETLDRLDLAWPDLLVLELMMPEMDGETLAARVKRRADIPILVLSAITTSESKAGLIRRYAEDYVTKPYDYAELVARIQRILRRLHDQIPVEELILDDDLSVSTRKREATFRGRRISLSPTEARFLATLAAAMPNAVSTEQLLRQVWSDAEGADPRYVWVIVRRLRQKIEHDPNNPRHLLTESGGGYRLAGRD